MDKNNNIRTMEYIDNDYWSRPVYKCKETKQLYKDTNLGNGDPDLYSCSNSFEGEPDCPIKKTLEIVFINQYKENQYQFEYMMLDRLRQDCDYFLSYGNKNPNCLWAKDVKEQIKEMKRIYCLLPKKPQYITIEQIKEYETEMLKDV